MASGTHIRNRRCTTRPADGFATVHAREPPLGYARVSTSEHDRALQREALKATGCQRVFTDVASGAHDDRPQQSAVLDNLRSGETLVV